MNPDPEYKLKVIAGVHKNAELIMTAGTHYRIGTDDECDIILMDKGVARIHLTLFLLGSHVHLKKEDGDVFIDGTPVAESKTALKEFQVVTAGQAHFAIGPSIEDWPILKPPQLKENKYSPDSLALLVVPADDSQSETLASRFSRNLGTFYDAVLSLNRKVLAALLAFALLFFIFWIDFILSGNTATATDASLTAEDKQRDLSRESIILSFIQVMMQIREQTMVGTGVDEPPIDITKEKKITAKDSTQAVRDILKQHWGPNLTEIPKANGEIEFKGHDSTDQTDLQLNLNRESDGSINARGYTHSKRQRKEILAQLGDIIRLKVIAADDLEHLSLKTLQKKKIREPNAYFDIDRTAITIEGKSSDQQLASNIEKIIAQSLPDIEVNNQVKFDPDNLGIVSASISGVAHVKLNDGSKIFPGGKLKNDCTVVRIDPERIVLNCNDTIIYHDIGDIQ